MDNDPKFLDLKEEKCLRDVIAVSSACRYDSPDMGTAPCRAPPHSRGGLQDVAAAFGTSFLARPGRCINF